MADENTSPTEKTLVIAGVEFTAPYKYAAGHVLNDAEARTLNQTRFENLRNNFAPKVKASQEGKEGAIPANELQARFAEFESTYEFSMPGAGGGSTRSLDPVEREALAIARELVKEKLAQTGRSYSPPRDASDEQKEAYKAQIAEHVARIAEKPEVVAQAKKNVANRDKGLSALAGSLDL